MDIPDEEQLPQDTDAADGDELYERLNIIIDKGQEPLRVDKFVMARIEGATRNKIQQAIEEGRILVNDQEVKSNYKIKSGDKLVVYEHSSPDSSDIIPQKLDLNIIYEDDAVMVINKPVGMVVHPGSGNPDNTLINGVAWHLLQQNPNLDETSLPRFGLVHRIDKNTSGLIVLAKTKDAMQHLAKQFFHHTVHRRYLALVWGNFEEPSGTIIAHVGRHLRFRKLFTTYPDGDHGKDAITHYTVLENFNYVTLIECRLETGRTHQIRVHMQSIGHPLFNDDFYGGDRIRKGTVYTKYKQFVDNCFELCPRQALHAAELGFVHPVTEKEMKFTSELPQDMASVIEKWRNYTAGLAN